jgi:hypothetical protein
MNETKNLSLLPGDVIECGIVNGLINNFIVQVPMKVELKPGISIHMGSRGRCIWMSKRRKRIWQRTWTPIIHNTKQSNWELTPQI